MCGRFASWCVLAECLPIARQGLQWWRVRVLINVDQSGPWLSEPPGPPFQTNSRSLNMSGCTIESMSVLGMTDRLGFAHQRHALLCSVSFAAVRNVDLPGFMLVPLSSYTGAASRLQAALSPSASQQMPMGCRVHPALQASSMQYC